MTQPASRPAQCVFALALIILSTLFTLLSCEIGLRICYTWAGLGFRASPHNELKRPSLIPWRMFGPHYYKERDGVRSIASTHHELYSFPKPPGTFRIVCFGGSTTADLVEKMHYPLRLQQLLRERLGRNNIEVINVAMQAYATPHSLITLELDVLSWQPDLLILSENINDLLVSYWPNFQLDYANKYAFYAIPEYEKRFTIASMIFQHSTLYWWVKHQLAHAMVTTSPIYPVNRKSYGNEPVPLVRSIFERNLRSFVALARANDIDVLFATQPLQTSEEYFLLSMAQKDYNDIVVYPLHEEFIHHHGRYNDTIKEVAQDAGIWFLDNNRILADRKELFTDFVHYSKQGMEQLAKNYADFLTANRIVE